MSSEQRPTPNEGASSEHTPLQAQQVNHLEPSTSQEQPIQSTIDPSTFKLWNPPQSAASTPRAELPDEFFEPTLDELKTAYQSQKRLRESLVDGPLRTQASRQADEKAKLNRWPNTTIRVKFPDRTQLEKTFPSTDKIKSIYAFVRNSLREDVKPIKFILYQAPPRVEFKVSDVTVRDKTLAELSLAPSSVLLLQFLDDNLNTPQLRAPLSEEMWKYAQDLPKPKVFDEPKAEKKKTTGGSKTQSKSGDKLPIPKWLSHLTKK